MPSKQEYVSLLAHVNSQIYWAKPYCYRTRPHQGGLTYAGSEDHRPERRVQPVLLREKILLVVSATCLSRAAFPLG